MPRLATHDLDAPLIGLLAAHPKGLGAPELQRLLPSRPSQPTLARSLLRLRAQGRVVVEGRARATRYHLASGTEAPKLRSRLLHERVAVKLVRDPGLIERAKARLDKLRSTNPSARRYHARWAELLAGPPEALLRALGEDSEAAADLRKESPFTTLLDRQERESVLGRLRV